MAKWFPVDRLQQRSAATKFQRQFTRHGRVVSLGREPAQNSRDNGDGLDLPVRMRFTWGTCIDPTYITHNILTNTWLSHATLPQNEKIIQEKEILGKVRTSGLPYLLIEDYNTTGLTGRIEQMWELKDGHGNPISDSKDTMYWFLRVVDESSPKKGRGGSHGMGKMAFPASSKISTMFVVSSREDRDVPRFWCGQTFLENYQRDGKPFGPELYFADENLLEEKSHPESWKYFREEYKHHASHWIPETDRNRIDEFCSVFGIKRNEDEKGTSIMIPFPWDEGKESITPERMEVCIITNYSLAIAKGQIAFEFADRRGSENNPKIVTVDSSNIRERISEINWDDFKRPLTNAGWSTRNRMSDLMDLIDSLDEPFANRVNFPLGKISREGPPTWQQSGLLPNHDDEVLDPIREALNSGKAIHLLCRDFPVTSADGKTSSGSFRLVIKRARNEDDAEAHFYRGHISPPQSLRRKPGYPGFSSLLVLEEGNPLFDMMRASEGAAHMRWDSREPQLKLEYQFPNQSIKFLIESVDALVGRISQTTKRAEPFLNELFSTSSKPSGDQGEVVIDTPDFDSYISVSPRKTQNEHGFVITNSDNAPDLSGRSFNIRVGYNKVHLEAGIPKRTPDPRVFDIAGGFVSEEGSTVETLKSMEGESCPDRFLVRILSRDFRVKISGLDLQRQARVVLSPNREED